jgi:hypothetical protein
VAKPGACKKAWILFGTLFRNKYSLGLPTASDGLSSKHIYAQVNVIATHFSQSDVCGIELRLDR